MNLDLALPVLLILAATFYALLGLRLVFSKREVGSRPVGVLFVVISFWVLGGAVEMLSSTFLVFSIGRTGHFIGTALVPVVAYVCFREYTGAKTTPNHLALLAILPISSIMLAATNVNHELMWFAPFANEAGEYLTRPAQWGPWFLFAHLPYSYALIGAAMFTLMAHSSGVAPAHRRGLFQLTAACVPPIIATALYDSGLGPDTISFVPIVFAAMLPVYAWLILVEGIFESTPLAYETVFQTMQDPVVVIDEQNRVIGLNHTAERMLSVSEAQALRMPLKVLFGTGAYEVYDAITTGEPRKMMTDTGRFLHVQVSSIDANRAKAQGGQIVMFRDVSDVEKAQIEIRKSEKLLRTLIDHSVNGVVRFSWVETEDGDRELRSIFANAAAGRFLSMEIGGLIDRPATEVIQSALSGADEGEVAGIMRRFSRIVDKGGTLNVEVRQRLRGRTRWLRVICEPVGDDFATTLVDITENKTRERQMDSIAMSDPLTGVLNRRGFERNAARRLAECEDDASGALLFLDLNGFKGVNDEFGHEVGDQLLKIAAERLRQSLRSCDIIGRPGGDEFVALVPDVDAEIADKLAKRLTVALEQPYTVDGKTLFCAASIGLALYPTNANTLTGLLREADQAMYRAKARCRGVANISVDDLLEKAI